MEKTQNNKDGLILIDKNRYENVTQVIHTFQGNSTVEDAIKNIVLSKVKDKYYSNSSLSHNYGNI